MRRFRKVSFFSVAFTVFVFLLPAVCGAQVTGGGPAMSGVNSALTLTELFGSNTGFTAQAEARVVDAHQKEELRMPMAFARLDRKIRIEIDVAKIKSRTLSADQVKQMQEMGLSHIISIIRPDKKLSYVLYPASQNYTIVPLPKAEMEILGKRLKLEKTALGKATVDGHSCVKNHFSVTSDRRVVLEGTTWNATDLKDFPVRIQTTDQGKISTLNFKRIEFSRPDPKLFEPPAGYRLIAH